MSFQFMSWAFAFNALTLVFLVVIGLLIGRVVLKIQKNATSEFTVLIDYVKLVKYEVVCLFLIIAVLFLFSGAAGVKREIDVSRPTVMQQESREIVTPAPRTETLDGFRPLR